MRLFITGPTGVLGRRVIPLLVGAGHQVTALARTETKAQSLRDTGVEPVLASLFDAEAMQKAVVDHDAVLNLATNIPTGVAAATRRGWRTNDRIRRDGSRILTEAARDAGISRFVQESITFPYADGGADWIDEDHSIDHHWGTEAVATAEANALGLAEGVVLRFAMFVAADSAHVASMARGARRGVFALPGDPGAYFAMLDADDAARAVVAALDAPAGVYNVAENEPATRAELSAAMARTAGKDRLRRIPTALARLGGAPARAMMRSLRISNQRFEDTTDWQPTISSVADEWETYV